MEIISKKKDATIIKLHGEQYLISKYCMPKEEAEKKFQPMTFNHYQHISRENFQLDEECCKKLKVLKSPNYVVRKVS